MALNYFKAGSQAFHFFDSENQVECFNAFGAALIDAAAIHGTVSVWAKPAVSGEWDRVPVIGLGKQRRLRLVGR